jgi:hypothetical protein
MVVGDVAGALSFSTFDASYTGTYADGITGEIASVSESSVGGAYGLAFYTATTTGSNRAERMRIDASGNVGIGTSSPATALSVVGDITTTGGVYLGGTGAANLLDDYEEGTFTPTFTINGGTGVGSSYTRQAGTYRKVGKVVYYMVDMTANSIATTAGAFISISGLPFQAADNTVSLFPVATFRDCYAITAASGNIIQPWVNTASTYIRIQQASLTTNATSEITAWDSAGRVNISGFYFTA